MLLRCGDAPALTDGSLSPDCPQILFLILVTDLPPSIALGFEPGEALTMKRAPRPKTQPVVMMWMWRGIVANGMILTICIFCTYMLALWAYAGAFQSDDITGGRYGNLYIYLDIYICIDIYM